MDSKRKSTKQEKKSYLEHNWGKCPKYYTRKLRELLNAPVGGVGALLLYTHFHPNCGTFYVLDFSSDTEHRELVIRAETLCQMGG